MHARGRGRARVLTYTYIYSNKSFFSCLWPYGWVAESDDPIHRGREGWVMMYPQREGGVGDDVSRGKRSCQRAICEREREKEVLLSK